MSQANVLTNLDNLRQELHCQRQKILSLEEAARYLSPAGDVIGGSTSPSDRVGRIAGQIADERTKLEELEERYFNTITEAIKIIESLPNPLEREVLMIRYISGAKWEEVAAKVDCSMRTCQRVQQKALKSFKKVVM